MATRHVQHWLCFICCLYALTIGGNTFTSATTNTSSVSSGTSLLNNCTKILDTFNRTRQRIKRITTPSIHKNRPPRPIDPFCLLPELNYSFTFMPNLYCPSMVKDLYCNKTEELQYLHKFYHSLGGDHWFNNTHWLDPAVDYCRWHGIYCCNTSYPLYKTCINIVYMTHNNLSGTLPTPWINSSVLTIFGASQNRISGSIPDYHTRLPNLSVFGWTPLNNSYSIVGPLPKWPSAGCMLEFGVNGNLKLDGPIPEWNKPLKYMTEIGISNTNLSGTLPSWSEWIWPYHMIISPINLSGTIPPWTNARCPTLENLRLNDMGLTGTLPPLPPQFLGPSGTTNMSIQLRGNKLSGPFPWHSLTTASYFQINDNLFSGSIVLPYKYRHFTAINMSNNSFSGMFPCLMNNHKLKFVDARFNNFDSIATAKESGCTAWPKQLSQLLLSNNKINAVFHVAVRDLTNMSIIDFGNNRFKGTVPPSLMQGSRDAIYLSLYDNDLSCTFPSDDGRVFSNGSWLYIGNRMQKPFAPYTNHYELSLSIVSIVPENDWLWYLLTPLSIGIICFLLYLVCLRSSGIAFVVDLRMQTNYVHMALNQQILYIMRQSILFITCLLFVGIAMVLVYTKGANFYTCGYKSLQWSITYLSDQDGTGYDVYSYLSLALFFVYSVICVLFVTRLRYLAQYFGHEDGHRQMLLNGASRSINVNPMDSDSRRQSNAWMAVKSIFCLLLLAILSFGPAIVYNIYHTIPSSHINSKWIPNLSSSLSQNMVIYVSPFLLAIAKFFGTPYTINKMQPMRNYRNSLIYIIRFITLIVVPIIILLVFDDGCFQTWKSLWDYCEKDDNGAYIHPQCSVIPAMYNDASNLITSGSGTYVCHGVCDQTLVPYRCIRRFFEVLGPLYVYKMSIAFWFPLLYYMTIKNYWKRICPWCNDNRLNVVHQRHQFDLEYMSLVSSLEIVIVFGWALPMLVVLYGITMYGYWCVFAYSFNNIPQITAQNTLKPAINWLILSLILQHLLAITFYWFTQSMYHGVMCIAIAFINILLFYRLHWYRMVTKTSMQLPNVSIQNGSSVVPILMQEQSDTIQNGSGVRQTVRSESEICHDLCTEIARNENEYRKYTKQHPYWRRNGQTQNRRAPNNDQNEDQKDSSNGSPNDNGDDNAPNDNNDAPADDGDDDKDEDKEGDENDDGGEDIYSDPNIKKVLEKVERLKEKDEYKIMVAKNDPLTQAEMIALCYYTDYDSACRKMKAYHRGIPTQNSIMWKQTYFYTTQAIERLYRVFHYENETQPKISYLFHGDAANEFDTYSQASLSPSTVISFTTKLNIALRFAAGCILVVGNVDANLYYGNVRGADVKWISKHNEDEFILLPGKYWNLKLLNKEECLKRNYPLGINVYMPDEYASDTNPLGKYRNYDDLARDLVTVNRTPNNNKHSNHNNNKSPHKNKTNSHGDDNDYRCNVPAHADRLKQMEAEIEGLRLLNISNPHCRK
eukprot:1018004_1